MRAVIIACAVVLAGCARANYVKPFDPVRAAGLSNAGCDASFGSDCFNVRWTRLTFGGRTYSEFILKIGRPNLADGSLIVGDGATDELDVELSMPEMGHGTGPVTIEKLDVGTYRIGQVYLPHGGLWEIRVRRLTKGRVTDEAALRATL